MVALVCSLIFRLAIPVAAPVRQEEATIVFEKIAEFGEVFNSASIFVTEGAVALEHLLLDLHEELGQARSELIQRDEFLGAGVAACEDALVFSMSFGPISSRSGTPFISYSLNFQPGVYCSRSSNLTRTRPRSGSLGSWKMAAESASDFLRFADNLVLVAGFEDGNDDYLDGRHTRRQHEPVFVGVCHDNPANEARGNAPPSATRACAPALRLRKSRRTPWQSAGQGCGWCRPAALYRPHHGFDGVGNVGAREFLIVSFLPGNDRHGELGLRELLVHAQHLDGFFLRFVVGAVAGVAFLPEELGGAKKQPGDFLKGGDGYRFTSTDPQDRNTLPSCCGN